MDLKLLRQPSLTRRKTLSFALGYFLFAIYLLSFSGKFHVMDELAVFTAAYDLAQHSRADINPLIWTNHWTPNPPGVWGQDGNLYTKKPPGISFMTAPLIWLGQVIPGFNAVHVGLLTNALITALTASLLFVWLLDLGFSQKAAAFTTLGYGLCTFAWVYARMFWESSLLALTFLIAIWASYRSAYRVPPSRKKFWLFLSGLAGAIGLTLRFEAALAVLFIGLYPVITLLFRVITLRSKGTSCPGGALFNRLGPLWDSEGIKQRGEEPANHEHFTFGAGFGSILSRLERSGDRIEGCGLAKIRRMVRTLRYALHSVPRYSGCFAPKLKCSPANLRRFAPSLLSRLALYFTPSFLIGLGLLYFNFIRFGSLGETGYTQEILFREPWVGALGLLFSPGRGLFIYAPLTLLLFGGLRPAWRRLPRSYFGLIATICLSYWLFYGSWFAWGGTWGWGPRFLLPILPLLMVFVAEQMEKTGRLTIYVLVALSLLVNFLGLAVDFNEHFLRLGSNDNFVFNWAAFPPLAHWQILREGLVDLIWLQPHGHRLEIEWEVFVPAMLLLTLAIVNLVIVSGRVQNFRNSGQTREENGGYFPKARLSNILSYVLFLLITITLIYLMMRGAAQVSLAGEQAQLDLPLLETLDHTIRPGDVLLTPMPPFGDAQEISTRLMAYLDRPLPLYAWIESEPRAIQPAERERVWQAIQPEAKRVWLFERWLTRNDPSTPTARHLEQMAFPVLEQWFERSGKLTLYALADDSQSLSSATLDIPFQVGLTLVDFAVMGDQPAPGDVLKLRLTWQVVDAKNLAQQQIPPDGITVFAQLLSEKDGRQVAQIDRLLVDLQNFEQSPLLPGQTVRQGYGLQLPENLSSGAYSLVVGLYQTGSGQRLTRADGSPDDFLYLTTVQVAGK